MPVGFWEEVVPASSMLVLVPASGTLLHHTTSVSALFSSLLIPATPSAFGAPFFTWLVVLHCSEGTACTAIHLE